MAKYCASCGKELPEGAQSCPHCGASAGEDGAALFTRISAETEGWQQDKSKRGLKLPKPSKSQRALLFYVLGAVFVVALAVFLILYIQPVNRVIRTIHAGDYDEAMELYWGNTSLAAGDHDASVQRAALLEANGVVERFARHELSSADAAAALGKLGTFGAGAEQNLAEPIAAYRSLSASQDHMDAGDRLSQGGNYLAAREEYLQVSEADASYAEAQEKAAESLNSYAESVLSDADVFIQSRDLSSAILSLENGKRILLGFDIYNEKLEYKLAAAYRLWERDLLAEAKGLAAAGEFTAAARTLDTNMNRFRYTTDALTEALDSYRAQAKDKEMDDAEARAAALYEEGRFDEAFGLLETLRANPESDAETLDRALKTLEDRFTADQIALAKAAFGGKRENLPEAVSGLKAALRVRELEGIQAYLDELSAWLPVSLAELEYVDKQGTIFRSASAFEGLDGETYGSGWVWGEDGAELTFELDGGYDLLEGVMAVRRDDDEKASGHFIVICDGEERYVSETLTHPDPVNIPVSVNISGCQKLTLRFVNDYTVRTAAGGYCYHGLCSPTITRDLDHGAPAPAEPAAEPEPEPVPAVVATE